MSSRGNQSIPLAVLLQRELSTEKIEKPEIKHGVANQSKKGEDFTLQTIECQKVAGDGNNTIYVFGLFDGHNESKAAIFVKENLLGNILGAIPSDLSKEDWFAALPRALVAGFVKTDKDFQNQGKTSGTTVTFVMIVDWVITVASVGDSSCVLESFEGTIHSLTGDHRLEDNEEERKRVTESGGEVGRLNAGSGAEEAVQLRGLRDDTTCIVVDILPGEKVSTTLPPPKKQGKGVFKSMFRKKSSEVPLMDKEHTEPDMVEELYEEGSAILAQRLEIEYTLCNMFKLFMYAVCQIEMKPGEGVSVHANSSITGKQRPWDGLFLCESCQAKREAMEGRRRSRLNSDSPRIDLSSE